MSLAMSKSWISRHRPFAPRVFSFRISTSRFLHPSGRIDGRDLVAGLGSAQRHGATLGEALGVSIPGRKPPWSRGTSERESVRQDPSDRLALSLPLFVCLCEASREHPHRKVGLFAVSPLYPPQRM